MMMILIKSKYLFHRYENNKYYYNICFYYYFIIIIINIYIITCKVYCYCYNTYGVFAQGMVKKIWNGV